jgi:hypothetical protein
VQLQEFLKALKDRQGKGSSIMISKRLEKKLGKVKKNHVEMKEPNQHKPHPILRTQDQEAHGCRQ